MPKRSSIPWIEDEYEYRQAKEEFTNTAASRDTHRAHPSDWRAPVGNESQDALEYIGPTTGWYMAPPCDADEIMGVYLIQARPSGAVKIGYSKDVYRRLPSLQTANAETLSIVGVLDLDQSGERELHKRFRHLRLSGEWFDATVLDCLDDFPRIV